MPAGLLKKMVSIQVFSKFFRISPYRTSPGDYFCCQGKQKSGVTTILGNMEYMKRSDKVSKISQSMGLKNKSLGAGKQNMNIISEKRKNSDSLNLKGKQLRKEIKINILH